MNEKVDEAAEASPTPVLSPSFCKVEALPVSESSLSSMEALPVPESASDLNENERADGDHVAKGTTDDADSAAVIDNNDNKNHNEVGLPKATEPIENNGDVESSRGSSLDVDLESTSVLPTPKINGWKQFGSLMRKNLIMKTRSPVLTMTEILAPLALVWILHAAFEATGVTTVKARTYTTVEVDVPGVVMSYLYQADIVPPRVFADGEEAATADESDDAEASFSLGDVATGGSASPENSTERSVEEQWQTVAKNRRDLNKFFKGPVPVPTLSQYVTLHRLFDAGYDNTVSTELQQFQDTADFGRKWGNLLSLGTIHLVGGKVASDFVDYVKAVNSPNITDELKFTTWEDEETALEYIEDNLQTERAWAVIDLRNSNYDEKGSDIEYTIRLNTTVIPSTVLKIAITNVGFDHSHEQYYFSGFVTLQRTVNEFFLLVNQCPLPGELDLWAAPMPTDDFNQNEFFVAIGFLLAIALSMAFLFPISRLIKSIVEEKESRMKQTLFILGVKQWAHWLSWLVFTVLFFGVISVLVTALLGYKICQNSDRILLFGFIFLFSMSIMGFSFFISSFFSKAKLASILGPLLFFGTLLPRYIFLGTYENEGVVAKMFASLAPCTAFAFGAELLSDLEYGQVGFQWFNVRSGGFDVGLSFFMLFFDSIFYLALAWYLEQVLPSEFGVRRKWYFIFTPRYWCRSCRRGDEHVNEEVTADAHQCASKNVQVTDDGLLPQIKINNLVKQYNRNSDPAVNNLSLSLYQDQITCLLGHNGAGKSTTMSVLTGLFPPTSGDCIIYNKSIRKDIDELRESMGICPQHNVIFDSLTVYEHIRFFEAIKGMKPTEERIIEKAKEVDLEDKLHSYARTLSGGMKRKLCVAMALCGEPKFVLLDEPTSGMDPYSRRSTWELLTKKKKGRVTLLTTHFMDEAELLADRIAVMKTGKLQCYGTSLFLKQRFGLGYNLTLVIDRRTHSTDNLRAEVADDENQLVDTDQCVTNVTEFLNKYIQDAELVRRSASELIYRFPQKTEDQFPALFDALEQQYYRENLGVGGYGISNTTLEEVFLRLAEEKEEGNEEAAAMKRASLTAYKEVENDFSLEQVGRLSQIRILFKKRWTIQKRDKKGFLFQIILPSLAVAIALGFLSLDVIGSQPSMEMSSNLYQEARRVDESNILVSGRMGNGSLSMEETFEIMKDGITNEYEGVSVDFVEDKNNSTALSEYILDTYNDHDHAWRFGSYVFNDAIDINMQLSWGDVRHVMNTIDPALIGDNGVVDVDRELDFEFDLSQVADIVYSQPNIGPDTPIDLSEIEKILRDAIADSPNGSNALLEAILNLVFAPIRNVGNVGELFSLISVSTGGTAEDLDATYAVSVDSMSIDLVKNTVTANNVDVNLVDMGTTISADQLVVDVNSDNVTVTIFGFETVGDTGFLNFFREQLGLDFSDNSTYVLPTLDDIEDLISNVTGVNLIRLGDPNAPDDSILRYLAYLLPEEEEVSIYYQHYANLTYLHNVTSPHAVSAYYQTYAEHQYKQCTANTDARIVTINNPLPRTEQGDIEFKTRLSIFASLFVLIPYCYAPAAFIIFIVKERATKSKHLQLVSGVDMLAYWIATYLWDMLMWMIFTIVNICLFFCFVSAEVFVGDPESVICSFLLTFGYGVSGLPFAYVLSRYFDNHTTAQISILGLFIITGFIAVIAYFILVSIESTVEVADQLRPLFRLWPAYNVGDGFITLSQHFWIKELLGGDTSPFDWDMVGSHITYLFGLSVPYFSLLILLEYSGDGGSGGCIGAFMRFVSGTVSHLFLRWSGVDGKKLIPDKPLDPDVENEKTLVKGESEELRNEASVLMVNLWKVFPPSIGRFRTWCSTVLCCRCFRRNNTEEEQNESTKAKKAIQGTYAAVMAGETFGLLGVNGAGKTTTMGILTGDLAPTTGEAYVAGFDVTGRDSGGVTEARKRIGFCPQTDPLLELMTARETLTMFGSLRGISREKIDEVVNTLIDALTLTPHADKESGKYSGGNKRKLSLGIAIIGNPQVLFIDEASSGMDPVARRKMWELINTIGEERCVMLTTHSMEEAEALCSRIGIMVAGQMRCIGSVQHLKSTYVNGYSVHVQCKPTAPDHRVQEVIDRVTNALPGTILAERHSRFLHFDIPSMNNLEGSGGLGHSFRELQKMKNEKKLMIETYSISQCTLEQVFIKLVKDDEPETNLNSD